MHTFRSIFKFEARGFLDKQNLIVFGLLLALALGMTQYGVYKFKQTVTQKKVFQQVEEEKVEQFFNWRIYGTYGFRLWFMPAPQCIFFINSATVPDMAAFVDSGERLKIYKSLKGKNTFELSKNWFTDFSGIILFFGSLLGLIYGYVFFLKKEYLKFLSSFTNKKRLFTFVVLPRAILLFLLFFFVTGGAVALVILNGIFIPVDKHMLIFFKNIFLTTLFFFAIGSAFSACKKKIFGSVYTGAIYALVWWFIFLFGIPTVVNVITAYKADLISKVYQLEMDKLKIVVNFEKKVIEKIGIQKMGEEVSETLKELLKEYRENGFKLILSKEENMMEQMRRNKSFYHFLSSFFPTTEYLSVNNEISSSGYENLLGFYECVKNTKRNFFITYLDKAYFSNFSKPEPFLKGDDNLYKAQPRLPEFLLLGSAATVLWILSLLMISYYRFKKSLFRLPIQEKKPIEEKILELKSGEFKSWLIIGNLLNDQLYNLLSGQTRELKKEKYNLKVSINGSQLNTTKKKQNFLYLCHPSEIPGHTRVCAFIQLLMDLLNVPKEKRNEIIEKYHLEDFLKKRFSQLEIDEYGQVFLALLDMKTFDIYLINDITRALFMDFAVKLDERMDQLCNDGVLVLFLTTDAPLTVKKSKEGKYFYDYYSWRQKVRTWRDANENDE